MTSGDDFWVAPRHRTTGSRGSPDRSPFWRIGFPALLVLSTLLIIGLAWAGKKVVLQSTDGTHLTEIADPTQPGYRVTAESTPTLLLVQVDENGIANSLTVMSLTGEGAGGMIFIPLTTFLDLPDLGKLPLNKVAEHGADALQKGVEGVLRTGMAEVRIVSAQDWTELVTPVGSVQLDNPDAVTVPDVKGTAKVIFPKGKITLAPTDVATYLATTNPGENDLNRLVRHKAFWQAWLSQVGTSHDPGVVPGETKSGLGRFVRTLADDRVEFFPLPVEGGPIPGSDVIVYRPLPDQIEALVARLVPFPVGAPAGARLRVRILDGTGTLDRGVKAAPALVEGGGEIDQLGNADSFGVATTKLTYYDDSRRDEVDKLRAALGVGEVVKGADQSGVVDVTVILGTDFLNAPPRPQTSVTAVPSGTVTTTIVGVSGGK